MARLIVRNVGPIKDVDINLKKVNVFMGPQGCGKSTLAKIISFCSWLEKDSDATSKTEVKGIESVITEYHRMVGYFRENSQFAYIGDDMCLFYHMPEPLQLDDLTDDFNITHNYNDEVIFRKAHKSINPKVAYIPAERNFVSVVPNLRKYAENDDSLQGFVNDWFEAKKAYTESNPLKVDILGIEYYYNSKNDRDIVVVDGQTIQLSQSSSGFQSIIPLMAMLSYLSSTIYEENKPFSPEENDKMREILNHMSSGAENEMEQKLIARIKGFMQGKVYTHTQFVIEEPEQNLFPHTQCDLMYHLLNCLNHGKAHKAVITTHSPYILYALNNCMLANKVRDIVPTEMVSNLKSFSVNIDPDVVAVWEIEDGVMKNYGPGYMNGTIQDKDGFIRKNYFNSIMQDVMREFSNMLAFKD